jgi:hypothetical protein
MGEDVAAATVAVHRQIGAILLGLVDHFGSSARSSTRRFRRSGFIAGAAASSSGASSVQNSAVEDDHRLSARAPGFPIAARAAA